MPLQQLSLDEILQIIDSEEELDGDPTPRVRDHMLSILERKSLPEFIDMMRLTVRLSKKKIRERIIEYARQFDTPTANSPFPE
jgi:hypothetical protein